MKRFFLSLLCVCLLCGALSVAAATPTVTTLPASNATLKVGDEITFTVRMEGVASVKSMAIRIGYGFDAAVFSFVKGEWLVESSKKIADVDETKLNAVILEPKSCTGEVFQFTLRVRENAPSGTTQVKAGAVLGMEGGNQTPHEVGCSLTVVGAPTTTTTSKPSVTTTTTSQSTSGTGMTTTSVAPSDKQTGTTTTGDRTQDTGTGSTVDSPVVTTEGQESTTVTKTDTGTDSTGSTAVAGSTTQSSSEHNTEGKGEDSIPRSLMLWGGLGAGAVILAVVIVIYAYNRKK